VLVTVDDRGRPQTEFKPLDVIRWFEVQADASAAETGYDVMDIVKGHLEGLLEKNEGLPLVARLHVLGDSEAHDELASDIERWTNELRSAAVDTGGGRIWIEKVKLRTRPPIDMRSLESASGPVGELVQYLDEVRANPDLLGTLSEALEDLRKKLPRELTDGEEAIPLNDNEWLTGLLEQVQPMLIRRLLKKEDSR